MPSPGVRVRGLPRCPPAALAAVRTVARRVQAVSPARHPVRVVVTPCCSVYDYRDGREFVGLFVYPRPTIIVAAGRLSRLELADTFLHEWSHYEQFRDGRPVGERGVRVRARGLMRRLGLDR